jgi:hypothetical protein
MSFPIREDDDSKDSNNESGVISSILEATADDENRALIAKGSDGDRDATCRDANRNAAVVDTNIVVAVIAVVVVDNEVQDGVAVVDESLRRWFGYQNKQRKKI